MDLSFKPPTAVQALPCPLCQREGALAYPSIRDHLFGAAARADYCWCPACEVLFLSQGVEEEALLGLYDGYYTHAAEEIVGMRRKIMALLEADLSHWRFQRSLGLRLPGGRFLLPGKAARLARLERRFRHLEANAPGDLLDVGCGDGAFLQDLKALGWRGEGIDFDPGAVAAARTRGVKATVGDLTSLPPKRRWDVITASHVLEHVPNPQAFLAACREKLVPGGALWLETPNVYAPTHQAYGEAWRGLEPPRHLVLFSEVALRKALLGAGFSRLEKLPAAAVRPWIDQESDGLRKRIEGQEGRPPIAYPLPAPPPGQDDFLCFRARA